MSPGSRRVEKLGSVLPDVVGVAVSNRLPSRPTAVLVVVIVEACVAHLVRCFPVVPSTDNPAVSRTARGSIRCNDTVAWLVETELPGGWDWLTALSDIGLVDGA